MHDTRNQSEAIIFSSLACSSLRNQLIVLNLALAPAVLLLLRRRRAKLKAPFNGCQLHSPMMPGGVRAAAS
jgi:hypothetical protein